MTNVEKLNNFKKNYPAACTGDLQSFCLGLKASEDNINFLKNLIVNIIDTLTDRDDSVKDWIEEQYKEYIEIFENEENI